MPNSYDLSGSSSLTNPITGAGVIKTLTGKEPATTVKASAPAPVTPTSSVDPTADYYAQLAAATRRQNQLLAAQIAAAPKLIKYDTAGAAAASLGEATNAQNPLYTQKLNDYLAKAAIARSAEQRHAQEAITDATDELRARQEQNALTGTRTTEDTATKIGEATLNENNFLDTSGTQFDEARTALQGGLATAGLAESGLGGQKLDSQQLAQKQDSDQQVHQFEQVKKTANLFKTRTLEDLAKSDETAQMQKDKTTGRITLNLEDFLNTDKINENVTRSSIEQERQAAILIDSNTRQKNKAQAFIAQLVKQGARPQDIALAAQIYGGGA